MNVEHRLLAHLDDKAFVRELDELSAVAGASDRQARSMAGVVESPAHRAAILIVPAPRFFFLGTGSSALRTWAASSIGRAADS